MVDELVLWVVVAERERGVAKDVVEIVYQAGCGGEAGLEGAGYDEAGVADYFVCVSVGVLGEVGRGAVEEELAEPDAEFERGLAVVCWRLSVLWDGSGLERPY